MKYLEWHIGVMEWSIIRNWLLHNYSSKLISVATFTHCLTHKHPVWFGPLFLSARHLLLMIKLPTL